MESNLLIPEEHFTSAGDLLEALTISTGKWLPDSYWNSPWVFRGQRKSEWDLTPTAWRTGNSAVIQRLLTLKRRISQDYRFEVKESFFKLPSKDEIDVPEPEVNNLIEAYSQARAEFKIILEFLSLADELGHPVPGADKYFQLSHHDYIPDILNYPLLHFLPEPNSATALAQHHGIPTRAVDWTYNPLVAAFFAAENISNEPNDGNIAVWAIRPDLLQKYVSDHIQKRKYCQFNVLKCPRSENSYLHAQEGLFLFPIFGCAYYAINGCWPTLEEYAFDVAAIAKEPVLRKLTLPNAHSGELLRLLWANSISRGHLMPTYDNVTKSIISKWEWWDY